MNYQEPNDGTRRGQTRRTARRAGMDLAQSERLRCRTVPKSPTLEADIATIRALYDKTVPGA